MSNEIKQGDKVRVSKDAPKVYLSSVSNLFKYHVCKVEETDGDSAKIRYTDIGIDQLLAIPCKYLVKVDADAKANEELQKEYMRFMEDCMSGEIYTQDYFLKELNPAEHEGAFIRQMEAELDEFRKAEFDRVSHPEKYHTYEVTVDNVAMDWQRCEADLAKEIALKVANKNMDNTPEDIGEYAVQVAKAVVENLKKK